MSSFKTVPYYVLSPNERVRGVEIPLATIAERVYGKPFDALRACHHDYDLLANATVVEYPMADEYGTHEEWLATFDEKRVYLGVDPKTLNSVVLPGVTQMEYWKSITWLPENSQVETISPEDVATYGRLAEENDPVFFNDYIAEKWRKYQAGESVVVEVNPPETKDLTGAIFEDEFFAQRAYSPSLGGVIADLIRRGDLPKGNFLFRNEW